MVQDFIGRPKEAGQKSKPFTCLSFAHVFQCPRGGQAVEPGTECGFPSKLMHGLVHLHKYILGGVFGVFGRRDECPDCAVHAALVAGHQRAKSSLATLLQQRDEFGVSGAQAETEKLNTEESPEKEKTTPALKEAKQLRKT